MREAELELGNLTIIAGKNNTGKTYLVYTIYGLIKAFRDNSTAGQIITSEEIQFFEDIAQELGKTSVVYRPLPLKKINQDRKLLLDRFSKTFSESQIANVFSSPKKEFLNSSVGIRVPEYKSPSQIAVPPLQVEDTGYLFRYDRNKLQFSIEPIQPALLYSGHSMLSGYRHFLVPELMPKISIVSAERFGISLFYKELDFAKNQLVNILQKLYDQRNPDDTDESFPWIILEKASSRYALPIKDNIQFTRNIMEFTSQKSELFDKGLFSRIEELMDGIYSASHDKIRFSSKTEDPDSKFDIPLHLASSSARGLSDLYFFLRHQASCGHLLIIDEPESHLDTANQVQLARMVAHFIRAGVRILVTTHSDYFLKEINNLIMLNKDFKNKRNVMKSLGYAEDDFIDPNLIRAYIAENHSLTPCVIDYLGIDLPLYDEVIRSINHASSELSSRVLD